MYSETNGLLPVTSDGDGSRVRWNAPPAMGDPDPPTLNVVSGAGTVTFNPAVGCYIAGSGYAECAFDYTCIGPACTTLQVQFQARLTNVAGSLLMNPDQFVNLVNWEVDGVAPSALGKALVLVGGWRAARDDHRHASADDHAAANGADQVPAHAVLVQQSHQLRAAGVLVRGQRLASSDLLRGIGRLQGAR